MAKAMSSPVMSSTLHESSQMVSVMAASSGAGVTVDAGAVVGVRAAVDAGAVAGVGAAVDAGAVAGAGVAMDAGAVAGAVVAGMHAGCSGWFSAKLSPRIARTQLAAGKSFVPMP